MIEFECEGTEKNKHFLYNITSLDENQHILTDSGSCNGVIEGLLILLEKIK